MPTLQLHQLRVASVAKLICDNFDEKLDTESVVLACLFHDMANIIKSELERFPDFLQPAGLEYWKSVKADYFNKYGPDEHVATVVIARGISLPDSAVSLLKRIGFSNLDKTDTEGTFENKICSYADMRVGPYGVISIEERLSEGRKRYEGRKHFITSDTFEPLSAHLRNIEKDIFTKTSIKPEEIDDEKIKETPETLRGVKF